MFTINKVKSDMKKNSQLITLLVFALTFLVTLAFAIYTNHAWEDWYITYRASKNLAIGNGLVYTVGQKVHTFTSPLGTLIPAVLNFITGNLSDDLVLWLFRLFNCALRGIVAVMILKIAQKLQLGAWAILVLLGMFILDAKLIDFSINGMETGLMVLFLSLLLYSLVMPLKMQGLMIGLAWSGLMWTRPDSFIYIIGLSLGFLIFNQSFSTQQSRLQIIRHYCIAAIVTTVLYTPWLVWAWSYYGSFIPHTVVAKGLSDHPLQNFLPRLLAFPLEALVTSLRSFHNAFLPAYVGFGGWPVFFRIAGTVLAWVCSFAWMLSFLRPVTRALSLAVLVGHLYLNFGTTYPFPWYITNVSFLSILVFALLIDQAVNVSRLSSLKATHTQTNRNKINFNLLSRSLAVAVLLMVFSLTLGNAYQLRLQQTIVEEGNRTKIGLWLNEHASSPSDQVFLECLGYIGFYSNLKMYDFPGLSSPEVVAARKKLQSDHYADLIDYLKPKWLVLRPNEVETVRQKNSILLSQVYSLVETFDVSKQISSYDFLPGREYLEHDQTFVVFQRQDIPQVSSIDISSKTD